MVDFLKKNIWYFYILIIWLVALFWYVYVADELYGSINPSISLSNLGLLGDSFNILTSLFAGLAFAAVLITIRVQKKELKETRDEFIRQREIMDLQQFDNKFFQMLSFFISISNDIKSNSSNNVFMKGNNTLMVLVLKSQNLDDFQEKYDKLAYTYSEIGHYFWNLYQLLKYIDKDFPEEQEKNKYQYIDIIRAQLSQRQLAMLFYNCLGIIKVNDEHYKRLIEKYKLLKHLRYESLFLNVAVKDKMTPFISKLIQEYNVEALSKSIIDKREVEDKSLF